MLDKSLFVSDEIHEREIKLADGKKHLMHFKEVPAGEFQRYGLAITGEDEEAKLEAMPRLIAASLVTAEGKPALTVAQAAKLKSGPMLAIFRAVQEVSGSEPKKTPTGASGTS